MTQNLPGTGKYYEELKRVARILEIVQLISISPRRYLRRDLANQFEVSERMIQKDFDVIRHSLRLPLKHSKQGYYFENIPRLPAVQYSLTEGLALLLAVQAARQVTAIDSPELAAAIARLEALFPSEFSSFLSQLNHQPGIRTNRDQQQEMLLLLQRALVYGRKVRIVYETLSRDRAISERTVRPYDLLLHSLNWHLIGYCEWREAPLMFKVARIHEAELLDDRYRIPADYDRDEYMGEKTFGILRGESEEAAEVVLRFDSQAGYWAKEEYWHPSQEAEEQEDGSILFMLEVTVTPELVRKILYYGSSVEVLAPAILRERVAEEHRKAAEIYQ